MIFLQSDVDELTARYAGTITTDLKRGEISAAYDMFSLFTRRLAERMAWVEARLKKPFDLTRDETYNPDRSKSPWPKDAAEADALWERRLKNEFLAERLASADKKDKSKETPAQRLQKRYDRFQKNIAEMTSEEVVEYYLSSLARIFDPHSLYLGPDTLEDFTINMKNSLFGIGAVLQVTDGYCTIKEVMPGGPAAVDKRLQPGDRITAVAQGKGEFVDIVGMRLRNAVKLIRGPKGSEVRLKIIPSGAPETVRNEISLIRDEIKITSQRAKAEIIEIPSRNGTAPLRAGIIQIPSFYGPIDRASSGEAQSSTTTEDVRRLLARLKEEKVDGVVLDLRNNGGGLLSEAVLLTGLFIDHGPVVQIKDSRGRKQVLEDLERGTAYDGPLVVLTNKMSASASEIVAGALQNYGRAVIIGDKSTHGKGTVQTIQELGRYLNTFGPSANVGAIKITIQKFYLPNGHSTQMRGVIPDIVLPSANDYLDLGEDRLPHALPWDEIESERFTPNRTLAQSLTLLKERSAERLRTNSEFATLAADIERLRQRIENPSVSLRESVRAQERAEEKARREAREAVLKAQAAAAPKVIRITFDANEALKVTTADEPEPAGVEDDEASDGPTPKLTRSEQFAADLHLQETLNVLGDLVGLSRAQPASLAVKAPPTS
jgi:carboxyl-terminal processing protease